MITALKAHNRIEIMFKKRKGFGLDSVIMIFATVIIISVLVIVSNVFLKNLADVFVPLTTTMPKFDPTGNYNNPVGDTTKSILGVYNMLRSGVVWVLAALLMVAGILFMLEHIEVVPAKTTYGMLSKGILYLFIFFVFPPVWDLYATGIEVGSQAIIDPQHTGQTPDSVLLVFTEIQGGITHDKPPPMDSAMLSGIVQMTSGTDIGTAFSDEIKKTLLGFIGSLMALMAAFMTYMFGTIRQVLTAVLITGLPVILILSLVPWFQGVTKRLLDTLFGISVVPIFSSLVMVTGAAYLGSITTHSVEEQWFAALAVLSLSTFMPTILVPILGSLFSSMTQMVSSGVGFGAVGTTMAARAGQGVGSGAYGAAMSAQHTAAEMGQSISGVDMVKAAMGGGAMGGIGGLVHGLSHVGSHALRNVGMKDLAYDVKRSGSQAANRYDLLAHQHGKTIGEGFLGATHANDAQVVMSNFISTGQIGNEQIGSGFPGLQQHETNISQIIQTVDSFAVKNDHKGIAKFFGYEGTDPAMSNFGKSMKGAVDAYRNEPEHMAKLSYMKENGHFASKNPSSDGNDVQQTDNSTQQTLDKHQGFRT